jgi:hypothetical protein
VQSVPLTHAIVDERSLALDAIVVGRLRENPALVDRAKEILARWQATSGPRLLPVLLEWRRILEGDFEEMLSILQSDDEHARRLRQSSPFCGEQFVTREERNAVIRSYRHAQTPT